MEIVMEVSSLIALEVNIDEETFTAGTELRYRLYVISEFEFLLFFILYRLSYMRRRNY